MVVRNFKRFSLIERSALTFESFLSRDFSSRFYSDQFLSGIAERRIELHTKLSKASGTTFLFATILAFFDLIAGQVSYSGLTIQLSRDLTPIIALMTSAALMQTITTFIDDQILFRFMLKLGSNIEINSFQIMLIDKMAINLWSDAIVPRFFGDKSGRGQSVAMFFLSFFMLVIVLFLLAYPVFMITKVFIDFYHSDSRWIAKALSAAALFLTLWTLLLTVIFSIKFKFYPADFHESDGAPTDEFIKKMQEKISATTE
jgi:hypothetical protein